MDVSVKEIGTARRKLNLEDEKDDDTEENEADVELPPPRVLTKYELGRIARMQENDAVCKSLGVPSLVSSMREATAAVKNRKRKGKDPEGCDEYIPKIEGEDDSDDSSEGIKSVKSKKPLPGPRTRSRSNAVIEIEKEPTLAAKTTMKQPKKAGTNREATSLYRPPGLIKPTCSKMFKQSSNCEATSSVPPGSTTAYLLMWAQQKANLAAPTMENVAELDQEKTADEEIEALRAPRKPRGRSKLSKVHARGPEEKVVINLNEEGQVISDDQNEFTNFLGMLAKDNVSLTYINCHVVPDELKKQMWEYSLASTEF
ncbi:hypothetical protein POM88_045557 [Heracleum sosnowskyi]|uniref:Uncharacterized protein n=1 Tax=Heracleum sosnowskyi TaxID=360622 RepID=A0AAD8M6I7_9APIA|nr:hypothetical protein POM88_045557 [Heracleum sosnowskyi]